MNRFKTPFYIMFHPIEGFVETFYHNWQSLLVANMISFLYFLTLIIKRQATGFVFNAVRLDELNVFNLFIQSVGIAIMFCALNWAVCTLFDGKGKLMGIWITVNYALLPYVLITIFNVVMSNVLKSDESMFMTILYYIGIIWTGFLLIKGLEAVHQYNIPQTLLSMASTVVGMMIVVFIFILLLSLSQQMIGFVITISKELMLRKY